MPINRHRWTKAAGGGVPTAADGSLVVQSSGGTSPLSISVAGDTTTGFVLAAGGSYRLMLNGSQVVFATATEFRVLTALNIGAAADVGLTRLAAGALKVTDGGAGTGWFQGDAGKTRLAANHTVATNSTTLAAINNLTSTVAAARHYRFRASLYFTTVNTSGVKVAISGTATHTDIIYDVIIHGISTPSFLTSGRASAKDTAVGVTASGTAANVVIEGFTTINAGGTLLVQAAQNAETGAAESVIALRGCSFEVTDFA